jgi:hypothetical protein
MKFQLERMSNPTKERIAEDIRRVDLIIGKDILTSTDYHKYSRVSHGTLRKYLGSWHEALCAAGLEHKSNRRIKTPKSIEQAGKYLTDQEILDELARIAKELGQETLTMKEFNENSANLSASTVASRFGWTKGLEKAGLATSPLGKRYTNDECFENLVNVWTHYGRQPKAHEMKVKPSQIGPKAYTLRWGSWLKALEAFTEEIQTPVETNSKAVGKETEEGKPCREPKIKPEDKRNIPYRLRYKLLLADNFKCRICGNSPATDPTCRLHVDHIFPFDKGGKTVFENLRTLCEKCNLGKGNLIEVTPQKNKK